VTPNFRFYQYGIEAVDKRGDLIDSFGRRAQLFDLGLWADRYKDMPAKEKESLKRVVFFKGSFFYSSRPLLGLEQKDLPTTLVDGTKSEGDVLRIVNVQCFTLPTEMQSGAAATKGEMTAMDRRCSHCTRAFADFYALISHCQMTGHSPVFEAADNDETPRHASPSVFLAYCNVGLTQAMSERMARWGHDFVDPKSFREPQDRNGRSHGIRVYESYVCTFGMLRPGAGGPAHLALTVDIKAKLMRSKSLLDMIADGDPRRMLLDQQRQNQMKRQWIGESIIAIYDKKIYHVTDLIFDQSPNSMPIEGLNMSHADYFKQRKGIDLTYPDVKLMVAIEGRRKSTVFLPPELVCGTEIDMQLKRELPMLTSYKPKVRSASIDEIRRYLIPGAQKTKGPGGGLLPALGIVLKDDRLAVKAETLSIPEIVAAGIRIPSHKAQNWAPTLSSANFKVNVNDVTNLNVVVVVHQSAERQATAMYDRVCRMVNNLQASFRFPDKPYEIVSAGDLERHWGAVEKFFGGSRLPDNVFVIDINRPQRRALTDPAYSVVKQMLGKAGYLSQFINLNTYDHAAPRDMRKSDMILQGCSRQILSKCGFRLWWVSIPKSIPLPAVFVGIDVFHAPRKYDPISKTRLSKASCAAIIVQVVRQTSGSSNKVEIYSETFKREASMEYDLGDAMHSTVSNALKYLKVSPASCIVWRDGVGDTAVAPTAAEEIPAVRRALAEASQGRNPSVAYIVCQKRITTKFVSRDGEHSAPPGTLIMGIQGLDHSTFYINGTCPSFATAKPVRFIVAEQDKGFDTKMLAELSWALCHDYPNWAGPVKVPGPVQLA
jgi:hypothetical protein